jgi:beta-glucanase (GH16 family)
MPTLRLCSAAAFAGLFAACARGDDLPVPGNILLGPGASPLDPAKNLVHQADAVPALVATPAGQTLRVVLPSGKQWVAAGIQPAKGRWRLTGTQEVRAKVRNDGPAPIIPIIEVGSAGGSVKTAASAPLAPGAETELVASYINPQVWKNTPPSILPDPGTGNRFVSNMVTQVLFSIAPGETNGTLTVESIKADLPAYSAPGWLGQRPPVDGQWTQTFDEEFNGDSIDATKWNIYAENYWDQRSHFSKDNVIVGHGVATLRYEKKTGHQGDDPTQKQTDYATGYLGTFGKWTQRYGYWEARMKVPQVPGLWPAFWLMPDRGEGAADRETTEDGGMEFDIMEFLSGWGPGRYNIAMHWDGYGDKTKTTAMPFTYGTPDKDGFITAGLLWTPGSAIYYCNGREVLDFESPRVSNVPSYILFDFVSGGWENPPIDDTKLPDDFVIDYVRVWQRQDLASPEDGPKTPSTAALP